MCYWDLQKQKIKCIKCNKEMQRASLRQHLNNIHNIFEIEKYIKEQDKKTEKELKIENQNENTLYKDTNKYYIKYTKKLKFPIKIVHLYQKINILHTDIFVIDIHMGQ